MENGQDYYNTVAKKSKEILFKEKNSKFFAQVHPIKTENEVKPILEALKKRHTQANHVCYAWHLGIENVDYRANDDGEPNNSAGMPIYGQIQSFEVTNVLITVTRIFGGTKLGVSGLINAYRTAAKLALEAAKIVKKPLLDRFVLKFKYQEMNKVMRIIKQNQINIERQEMELECEFLISIIKSKAKKVFQSFDSQPNIYIEKSS